MTTQFWTIQNGKVKRGEVEKIDPQQYPAIAARAVERITPPRPVFHCTHCSATVEKKGDKCLACVKYAAEKSLRNAPVARPSDRTVWLMVAALAGMLVAALVFFNLNPPKNTKPVKTNREINFQSS